MNSRPTQPNLLKQVVATNRTCLGRFRLSQTPDSSGGQRLGSQVPDRAMESRRRCCTLPGQICGVAVHHRPLALCQIVEHHISIVQLHTADFEPGADNPEDRDLVQWIEGGPAKLQRSRTLV